MSVQSVTVINRLIYCHLKVLVNSSKSLNRYFSQQTNFQEAKQEVYLKEKYKKKVTGDTDTKISSATPLLVTEENQYELLNELMTPLWNIPYKDQLKMKWRWSRYVFNKLALNKHAPQHILQDIIPSPVTEEYRNKSEMNVRKGVDGNMKTVGCFIGATGVDHNKVVCVPPTHLVNTPKRHKEITQMYQDFIRNSPLPAMHDLFDDGFWRGLVIRTNNQTGDTMVVTFVHPQNFSGQEIHENMEKLKRHFEDNNANLTSLYYQASRQTRCTNEVAPYRLLSGEPYLTETLHDYKFRVSPDSFFQINKPAAEVLYSTVINLAQLKPNTVLLDLCCGTGAISLLCSSHVRSCLGIDVTAQAIEDAKANMQINDVTNCQFIHGRIEKILEKVLQSLNLSSDIVAVLNPTRNGVDPSIIKAIRNCNQISQLIYISCKADAPSTFNNFKDLRRKNLCAGKPFFIRSITPVDLFPHTNYCELVLLFDR